MRTPRKPTPADFGLNVTLAVACITNPNDVIVCVSDRKLSWAGDRIQADDNAVFKTLGLSVEWKMAYACEDISAVYPIFERTRDLLRPTDRVDSQEIKQMVHSAYVDVLQNDFFSSQIARYGYRDFSDFKSKGQADLGPIYFDLMREFSKHSIGVELIIMGYDKQNHARLFGIDETKSQYRLQSYADGGHWKRLLDSASFSYKTTDELLSTFYGLSPA